MLHNLKMLIRSRSWSFVRSRKQGLENYKRKLYTYKWNNRTVYYRPGTSDRGLVYNILIQKGKKAEYHIPNNINASVILDIGGNIGITAIWMARKFPDAKIYCFEPIRDNFDILQKNIEPYENITTFNFGLGAKTSTVDIYANEDIDNQGGFSMYQLENDGENSGTENKAYTQIEIKNTATQNSTSVQLILLKLIRKVRSMKYLLPFRKNYYPEPSGLWESFMESRILKPSHFSINGFQLGLIKN